MKYRIIYQYPGCKPFPGYWYSIPKDTLTPFGQVPRNPVAVEHLIDYAEAGILYDVEVKK